MDGQGLLFISIRCVLLIKKTYHSSCVKVSKIYNAYESYVVARAQNNFI